MITHPAIGTLKVLGWIFLLVGVMIGVWFLASIISIAGQPADSTFGLANVVAIYYLILAIAPVLSGAFMCALCYVLAIIAEGTLANGQRLKLISRQLAAQSRTRPDTIEARVRRMRP